MNRFLKIGAAAKILGVSIQTMRRWETTGYLKPDRKSEGGIRYYNPNKLLGKKSIETALAIAYARVSSHDQKKDLERLFLHPIAQQKDGNTKSFQILDLE